MAAVAAYVSKFSCGKSCSFRVASKHFRSLSIARIPLQSLLHRDRQGRDLPNLGEMYFAPFSAFLLIVACIPSVCGIPNGVTIPQIHASGTHYQVGFQVGTATRQMVKERLATLPNEINFVKSNEYAKAFNASLFNASVAAYPEFVEEIRGLADGCGMPFGEVWLLSCLSEIGALYNLIHHHGSGSSPKEDYSGMHCSDIFTNAKDAPAWGHNEDSGLHDVNHTYLVDAVIVNETTGGVVERFVAYTYTGTVAGKAFGWNSHGLVLTFNALMTEQIDYFDATAVPRSILSRALLTSRTVVDVISMLHIVHAPTAFSVNIGTFATKDSRLGTSQRAAYHNINVAPFGKMAITSVLTPSIFSRVGGQHVWPPMAPKPKLYNYQANIPESLIFNYTNDTSSVWRIKRMLEFPAPVSSEDIQKMLGDTKYEWPLWRHGVKPDLGFTLCTAMIDLEAKSVALFVGNPKNTTPALVLPLVI